MTDVTCAICGKNFQLDINEARIEHRQTFGKNAKDEVVLCRECYEKILSAALGSASNVEN